MTDKITYRDYEFESFEMFPSTSSAFITARKVKRTNLTSINFDFSDDEIEIVKTNPCLSTTPQHIKKCAKFFAELNIYSPPSVVPSTINYETNKEMASAIPMASAFPSGRNRLNNKDSSPTLFVNNEVFNVSFENSDNEKNSSKQEDDINSEPLQGTFIYVDVRAENENRSKAISRELEKLGATIVDKITDLTTHVVYKDGRKGTLTQLKKFPAIYLVSVLWVDSCKTTKCRVNEGLYRAKLNGDYDSPLPIARSKRVKSLQPKTFEEDISNSGKREERKKRRLKKLLSNKETTPYKDDILCLDSQDYIKSSDLYKLVATPRIIPDTPWILNYINGSQDEQTIESTGVAVNKTEVDQSHLENVQCKLDFHDNENSDFSKNKKDITQITYNKNTSDNFKRKKKSKVAFANQSLCTARKYLNKSPENSIIDNESFDMSKNKASPFKSGTQKDLLANSTTKMKSPMVESGSIQSEWNNKSFDESKSEASPFKSGTQKVLLAYSANKMKSPMVESISMQSESLIRPLLSLSSHNEDVTMSPQLTQVINKVNDYTIKVTENKNSKETELSVFDNPVDTVDSTNTSLYTNNDHAKDSLLKPCPILKRKKKLLYKAPKEKLGSPALQENDMTKSAKLKFAQYQEGQPKYVKTSKHYRNNTTSLNQSIDAHSLIDSLKTSKKDNYTSILKEGRINETAHAKQSTVNSLGLNSCKNPSKLIQATAFSTCSEKQDLHHGFNVKHKKNTSSGHLQLSSISKNESIPYNISSVSVMSAAYSPIIPAKTKMFTFNENEEKALCVDNGKNVISVDNEENILDGVVSLKNILGNAKQKKTEKHLKRRTSDRIKNCSRRSSGIDFKSTKTYRKTNKTTNGNVKKNKVTVTECDNHDAIDLNVSYVHDETEGLIYVSFQDETSEEIGSRSSRPDENANLHVEDIDSGISDSEEIIMQQDIHQGKQSKEIRLTSNDNSTSSKKTVKKLKSTKENKSCNKSKGKKPIHSLVLTSLHFGEQEFAKNVLKLLGGFTFRHQVTHNTTHIIAGNHRRTLNILHGIVKGCWIVTPKWLSDCYEQGKWLNEEQYEMHEEFPLAKVARINRINKGTLFHAQLFHRLPCIYLAEVTCPSNEELIKLITSCGGKITTSLRKAGIGIGLVSYRRKEIQVLSEKWLLDSISNGRIMPTKDYEIRVPSIRRDASPCY